MQLQQITVEAATAFCSNQSDGAFKTVIQEPYITKTCLYNIDPLKPHFYIVKLGFTRVYIIFLTLTQNIDCGYSLEPPRTHNLCFEQKYEKNIRIFS